MNFKQKFGYMFIGCLFTLIGYFFASLGSNPSPPDTAHAQQNKEVIEKLICKEIVIVKEDGEIALRIGTKGQFLPAGVHINGGERLPPVRAGFGGAIDIYNHAGKVETSIGSEDIYGGSMSIFNSDGKQAIKIAPTFDGAGRISIFNKDGKVVASIGANDVDSGIISIYNKDEEMITALNTDKDGRGIMSIYNKDGKLVVNMGATPAGNGFIQSFKGGWKTH